MLDLGTLLVNVKTKGTADTKKDLKSVGDEVSNQKVKFDALGQSADKMNSFMRGAGVAAAGAVGGLVAMGLQAASRADDLNTLAKQTGLSTEELQIFQYASDRIDVSLETLTGSMSKLTKNMYAAQQGSKNQAAAFAELGVQITDNEGKLRSNQDVMNDCINALGQIENNTQRDALAMQIFGKSAQDLNPLILGGADALKQMGEEAKQAGLILDQDTLDAANELNDAVDKMKATATGAFAKIGAEVATDLTPMIEPAAKAIGDFVTWILDNKDAIVAALAAIGTGLLAFNVVTMIQGLVSAFTAWKTATEGMTVAQRLLNLVMAANPLALIISLIAGLVIGLTLLWQNCEGFRNFWIACWEGIKTAFFASVDFVKTKFDELRSKIDYVVAQIKEKFNNLVTACKELPTKIKEGFKKIVEIGKNLIVGLWNGINDKVKWLKDKVKGVVDNVMNIFTGKKGFDEHSPSVWAEQVGIYLMEGLAIGITEDMSAEQALQKKCDNLKNILTETLSSVDIESDLAKSDYDLWLSQNPNATESEKSERELLYLEQEQERHANKVAVLNVAYDEQVKLTGENSDEAKKLKLQINEESKAYYELANQIREVNKLMEEAENKAYLKTMNDAVKYGDMLRSYGYSNNQIMGMLSAYNGASTKPSGYTKGTGINSSEYKQNPTKAQTIIHNNFIAPVTSVSAVERATQKGINNASVAAIM